MKRWLGWLLAVGVAPAVWSQTMSGPAQAPTQMVDAQADGKCRIVHPGDTVNFTLTIDSVDVARAVYGDLELRQGRGGRKMDGGLPSPDARNLGGGGIGARDAQTSNVFHFSFRVPMAIVSGQYRGVGILVSTDAPVTPGTVARGVDVTRKTRDQVKKYCLTVSSGYGVNGRPVVTSFQPVAVEPKK